MLPEPAAQPDLAKRVLTVDGRRRHGRDLFYRDLAARLRVLARDYDAVRALPQELHKRVLLWQLEDGACRAVAVDGVREG